MHAAGDGFAPKPIADVTEEDWDTAVDVTAKGTFFLAQAAAPALREQHGVLVILEDVASYQAWPSFAAHCAAKAAQAMLTRVLARALAPEVRVCGIAPGPVAVEPDPLNFARLAENVRRNDLAAELHRVALDEQPGEGWFHPDDVLGRLIADPAPGAPTTEEDSN